MMDDYSAADDQIAGFSDDAEMAAMEKCPHQEAVFWNPYNHVVQCHRCGVIFGPWDYKTPLPESVAPHIDVNAKRPAPAE